MSKDGCAQADTWARREGNGGVKSLPRIEQHRARDLRPTAEQPRCACEAEPRAAVAAIAFREARWKDDLFEKLAALPLARAELLKSLGRLDEWPKRIPE